MELRYYVTCFSLNMRIITRRLKKNPKNPMKKRAIADNMYPAGCMRSSSPADNGPSSTTASSLIAMSQAWHPPEAYVKHIMEQSEKLSHYTTYELIKL